MGGRLVFGDSLIWFGESWLGMARLARVEVFAADEIAIVHVMNRTVRRCFLLLKWA